MYHIAPSSIHGLGLFSMDDIKVKYGRLVELFEYAGPCYTYGVWLRLVQYMPSMRRYTLATNYIQLKDNNKNKGENMYIDGRPKASGNIASFINSTRPEMTRKEPNCIFEESEGNRIFVCAVKKITTGKELLVDYNLNRFDPGKSSFAKV
jgi:SET domain-containing protein